MTHKQQSGSPLINQKHEIKKMLTFFHGCKKRENTTLANRNVIKFMVASQPFSSFEIVLQCSSTENGWVSFVTSHFFFLLLHLCGSFFSSSSLRCCYFNATVADSFFTRQILCKAITFTVLFFISSHHIFFSSLWLCRWYYFCSYSGCSC